jgi:hypothetical protein
MLKHDKALWRVEFRTNLTRSDAPIVPVAYLLEAHWENHVRWLGMLFRKRLTVSELDLVDTETWPEMGGLEKFMSSLFDEAWTNSGPELPLGSSKLAPKYSIHSALQFAPEGSNVSIDAEDPVQSFPALYAYLLDFREKLSPVATAPVVPFKPRQLAAAGTRADVELTNKAA